jgi:hypothetical protein
MNDLDQDLFEAELRRLKPAQPPTELIVSFAEVGPGRPARSPVRWGSVQQFASWRRLLGWWASALAAAGVAALILWRLPDGFRPSRDSMVGSRSAPPAGRQNVASNRLSEPATRTGFWLAAKGNGEDMAPAEGVIPGINQAGFASFCDLVRVSYEITAFEPGLFSSGGERGTGLRLAVEHDGAGADHHSGDAGSRRLHFSVRYTREL